jgi:hypothetical protein
MEKRREKLEKKNKEAFFKRGRKEEQRCGKEEK